MQAILGILMIIAAIYAIYLVGRALVFMFVSIVFVGARLVTGIDHLVYISPALPPTVGWALAAAVAGVGVGGPFVFRRFKRRSVLVAMAALPLIVLIGVRVTVGQGFDAIAWALGLEEPYAPPVSARPREPARLSAEKVEQPKLEPVAKTPRTVFVTASSLNVRAAPRGRVVGRVSRGDALSVVDEREGWLRVQAASGPLEGWVSSRFAAPDRPPPLVATPRRAPSLTMRSTGAAQREPPTVAARPSREPRVIFSEAFSSYAPGSAIPDWGERLVVVEGRDGRRYLTSVIPGQHQVYRKLEFPERFRLEYDWSSYDDRASGKSAPHVRVLLDLIGEDGDVFRVECGNWGARLPGMPIRDFSETSMNRFKLEREGDDFAIYNNGRKIQSGSFPGVARFVAFRMVVAVNRSRQGQRFTAFQVSAFSP